MSPPRTWRPVWACALLLFACSGKRTQESESIALSPGAVYSRAVAPGQSRRFSFDLPAGRFLRLIVEQREVDVVVFLRGPAGRGDPLLFEADSPNGPTGPETVLAVTPAAGRYTLIVQPYHTEKGGRFDLVVRAVRPARSEDRLLAAAAAADARAERRRADHDNEAAIAAWRKALPFYQRLGRRDDTARVQWRLGQSLLKTGDLAEAGRALEQAAAGFRTLGDRRGEARAFQELGAVHRLLGEPDRALEAHEQALRLYREAGLESGQASALNDVGLVLESSGHLQGAIDRYEEALALWRKVGSKSAEATTLQNLGSLYVLIGQDEEGMDFLQQALRLVPEGDDRTRESVLIAVGWAEYLIGQPERSLDFYRQAIALARAQGDRLAEAGAWDRRGSALRALRRHEEASESYSRALAMSRAAGSRKNEGHTLANLGWLDLDTGDVERARDRLRQAADLLEASGDPNGETFARVGICRADRRLGDYEEAEKEIEKAVRLIDDLRSGLESSMSRGQFLATRYSAVEEQVALLMDLDRIEPMAGHALQALEVVEKARARNLAEAITARAEWPAKPSHLNAAQIQSLAGEGMLFVVFLLADPESYAWTVDRQSIEAHRLPGRERIERLSRRLVAAFSQGRTLATPATLDGLSRELSEAILGPLRNRLRGKERLIVLADGALNAIPFSALPDPDGQEEPLLVSHEIVMLPSATFLAEQRRRLAGRPPAPRAVAALVDPVFSLADPRLTGRSDRKPPAVAEGDRSIALGPFPRLPETAREAESILRLVPPGQSLLAEGTAANRDLVASGALDGFRIVHFATHGVLHPVLPERSGLVLSLYDENGRRREGFLSAPEVARLDLSADLVVLSACQTGLGREQRGEGLVGLTQAFFRAGARRVVVSYWSVQDRATAELMSRFYHGLLAENLSTGAALRSAQLAIRSDKKWHSPYFWAAFTLHGDWR